MMRGNELKPVFLDHEDKEKFLNIMLAKKDGASLRLYAYCIMDNHIHMLIHAIEQPLERFMKRIGITYAAYFNKKYNRVGHVFQDRFRSEAIEDEAYLLNVIRYIHKNPFGPKQNPTSNYPWSSYPAYTGYAEGFPLLPEMEDILCQFSSNRKSAIQQFCEFHLADNPQGFFLDTDDERGANAKALLAHFLQSHSMRIEDLRKQDHFPIVVELIQLLLSQSKSSCRQIAELLGINREKVRKIAVSLEPSP
jgi:REP element-mobilizing transposase RayT